MINVVNKTTDEDFDAIIAPPRYSGCNRTRDYYRKMRAKHIKRKKAIASKQNIEWYPWDGGYSKNKVHCSCGLCACRNWEGRHILTKQEIMSADDMSDQLRELEAV